MIPLGVFVIVYLSFNEKFSTNDFIDNINTWKRNKITNHKGSCYWLI